MFLVFLAVFFVFFASLNLNLKKVEAADLDASDYILKGVAGGLPGIFGVVGGPYVDKALDAGDVSLNPFKWLLAGMLKFCVWMLGGAVIIFDFVVEPDNASFIMGNPGVYQSWAMVRDFLNLGFILVLLYVAFCVIFQIGSYSDGWKKMLLMMVIMALLVNFSFPIARVIVDISNVAFYYLLNVGFDSGSDGASIFAKIADDSQIATILNVKSVSVGELMARVVFAFILGLTMFVIATMFVVRFVAIGLLIIFSPIGFAGAAFPFSQKYSKDWWDNLFKYSFFAPIMIFMIIVASKIMDNMSLNSFSKATLKNLGPEGVDPNFIGSMAFFTIPVVILWFGMGMAQKMSIAGAGAVTGMAEKAAKWAGKQTYRAPWALAKYGSKSSGLTGAVEARWKQFQDDKNLERLKREGAVGGRLGVRGAGLAYEQAMAKRVKEAAEHNDTSSMDNNQLRNLANSADQFESAAALQELANRGRATQQDLDKMRQTFGETSQVFKQLQNKVKTYDPVAAFAHLSDGTIEGEAHRMNALVDHVNSNQFDHKKLNSNSLKNTDFLGVAFDQNALDAKKLEEIRNSGNASVIEKSITDLATSRKTVNDANKKIHMAAFSHSGNVVSTGNAASDSTFLDHVVSKGDKDTWKRAKQTFVNNTNVQNSIAVNMRPNKIKQIITNMDSADSQRDLAAHLRTIGGSPNADRLKNLARKDSDLKHL
jgi:hypothetical protein